jgi:hypothetical protein
VTMMMMMMMATTTTTMMMIVTMMPPPCQVYRKSDGLALAASFQKGDAMTVVIRGTVTQDEWALNFHYEWCSLTTSSQYFPGRVHNGFFEIFAQVGRVGVLGGGG